MTENELVERMKREFGSDWYDFDTEVVRSYANGLVAATVEACAKRAESKVKSTEYDEALDTDEAAWLVAQSVRNVTPESAAKELERIKAEARLDEHLKLCPRCTRKARRSRGACFGTARALEAAKEK